MITTNNIAIKCFMVIPSSLLLETLRRWSIGGKTCSTGECHIATSIIDRQTTTTVPSVSKGPVSIQVNTVQIEDPRWPVECRLCSYEFTPEDGRSHRFDQIWERQDNGEKLGTLEELSPGAMYNAEWLPYQGEDELSLVVILPDQSVWYVDGPMAKTGGRWNRKGVPPEISVTPSIKTDDYHGYLRGGILV